MKTKVLWGILIIVILFTLGMTTPSTNPNPLPTPFPTEQPKQYLYFPLALYEYPWAYGWVEGTIVNKYDGEPYTIGCVGLAKVWKDIDGNDSVFVFDDAWSPRARIGYFDDELPHPPNAFRVHTWVEYAKNGEPPLDGGTGKFVIVIIPTCQMAYGKYDIIEDPDNPYVPFVVRVYPDSVTDIGKIGTWLENETALSSNAINMLRMSWKLEK